MDLLLKSANLTALLTTWHGALSQVNATLNRFTLSQPPTIIYKTAAKDIKYTKIPGQHTWRAIRPQVNCLISLVRISYGLKHATRPQVNHLISPVRILYALKHAT